LRTRISSGPITCGRVTVAAITANAISTPYASISRIACRSGSGAPTARSRISTATSSTIDTTRNIAIVDATAPA